MTFYWQRGRWHGGKCVNYQNASRFDGGCDMGLRHLKCARCVFHKLDCEFDTPEKTEQARSIRSRLHNVDIDHGLDKERPESFGALRWNMTDDLKVLERAGPDVVSRLLKIEVVTLLENVAESRIIWRKEHHLIGGVQDQWCNNVGIAHSDWSRVYLSFRGQRLGKREECATVLEALGTLTEAQSNKQWIEVIVEAKMEEADSADSPTQDGPHRMDWRGERNIRIDTRDAEDAFMASGSGWAG